MAIEIDQIPRRQRGPRPVKGRHLGRQELAGDLRITAAFVHAGDHRRGESVVLNLVGLVSDWAYQPLVDHHRQHFGQCGAADT